MSNGLQVRAAGAALLIASATVVPLLRADRAASAAGLPDRPPSLVQTLTAEPETRTAVVPDGDVERIAGDTRITTALAASRRAFPDGAPAVVIATAWTFPDALTAAPLARQVDGPLLLVGDTLREDVADEIERLGATEAVITGAVGAVPYVVQRQLEDRGLEVRRLAGESRFDTAALTATELGLGLTGEVALAAGGRFPDALSIGPLAAAQDIPILLIDGPALPLDTAEALAALDPDATLVLGGEEAVPASAVADVPAPRRVSGPDRFATSAAIADLLAERGGVLSTVYVATGGDFPDALAAGPIASFAPGPLLLVDGRDLEAADAAWTWLDAHRDDVTGVVVFGGPSAVSDAVVERLRTYAVEGAP